MKTKVKTITSTAYYDFIDEEINQTIDEIEKNGNIIENIKITHCGQANIIILIIYKEIEKDNDGLEYLTYCEDENNSTFIDKNQNTIIYDTKTFL